MWVMKLSVQKNTNCMICGSPLALCIELHGPYTRYAIAAYLALITQVY